METISETVGVVMDAVGSDRAAILGCGNGGGQSAMLFAATHPERTHALVLLNAFARFVRAEDYPVGMPALAKDNFVRRTSEVWGTPESVQEMAPSLSAALNFVLHCLPGPQSSKAVAVRNVAAVLESDGVLFGGTVLGVSEGHSRPARAVLRVFNRQGAFDNMGDTADGLRDILKDSFEDVTVDIVGSVALFTASRPQNLSNS